MRNQALSDADIDADLDRIRRERLAREGKAHGEHYAPDEPWPKLDNAALHGLAGDFVKALEPHTETDSVGILIQFLAVFGSMVGRSPFY